MEASVAVKCSSDVVFRDLKFRMTGKLMWPLLDLRISRVGHTLLAICLRDAVSKWLIFGNAIEGRAFVSTELCCPGGLES